MARQYARGKNAIAECQRSGQKMRYRDLVEDGHVPGLLVHPDWWEPKHPQETPVTVNDPIALRRPAPEISIPEGQGLPENLDGTATPTTPSGAATGIIAVTAIVGGYQIVVETAAKYTIGDWLLVELDSAAYFVSRIRSTVDVPSFVVPFTSPFVGVATAGNDFHIEAG